MAKQTSQWAGKADLPGAVIRASDLGQYMFCRRAWWYRSVKGLESANVRELAAGEEMHRAHGDLVRLSVRAAMLANLLLILAALVLAMGVLALVSGR